MALNAGRAEISAMLDVFADVRGKDQVHQSKKHDPADYGSAKLTALGLFNDAVATFEEANAMVEKVI